jgi:hypothetical protein
MEVTGMEDQLLIEHPTPRSLRVEKTRAGGLRNVLGVLAFYAIWYGALLAKPLSELWHAGHMSAVLFSLEGWVTLVRSVTHDSIIVWFFLCAPLLGLPQLIGQVKISLFGEVLLFDGFAKTVVRDSEQPTKLSDRGGVEIKSVLDDEGPDKYRVSVLLKDGSRLLVSESSDVGQMTKLAGDIAGVLNTKVVDVGK